jgi:ribosomal protein S18 acetylase RimI-like enzyme
MKTTNMQSETVYVRALTSDDAVAFRALRLQAIADSPSAVWPTVEEESARSEAEIGARIVRGPTQVVFGAFEGTRLVGIAGLRREALVQVAHKATVWGVFVHPGCRHHGIARMLFACARTHAVEAGVLQIQLCVNAGNQEAKALYRSLGFITFGVEPRAMQVGGRFYDEEHMVLRLDAAV